MWNPFKSPRVPQGAKSTPLVQFRLGRRFDPGAEAEVFEQVLNNPVYLFRGNGRVAGVISPIQPPAVYINGRVLTAGLGGIQAGQYVGQPLIDPSQLNSEGGE
jgi:hypothetical protein